MFAPSIRTVTGFVARSAAFLVLLAPASLQAAEDPPKTVCELMATLAPDWLASHQEGDGIEKILDDTLTSFDNVGLTADTDRGATFRTAASISLIGHGQMNPKTPDAASDIALEYCAIWYRSRGKKAYQIPDRPMIWE